jgi:thiamine-monophosphate kinase
MASEFDLIRRHFIRPTHHSVLGVGDDCAIVAPRAGFELLVSTDMLVAGTHFFADTDPEGLGWKTAAVNISDIAAMGGEPRWITLALSLPAADEAWIAALAKGFADCCDAFGVDWIGGDTTRGPLNLCATVFGEAPAGAAIRRSGAQPGDEIWISGQPGLAALGLQSLLGRIVLADAAREACLTALHRPQPRVGLGLALRGIASAMLDVSDGLAGDLGHVLESSAVGALLEEDLLPLNALRAAGADAEQARHALFSGGDDYELVFAAPADKRTDVLVLAAALAIPLTRIGHIVSEPGIALATVGGTREPISARGYDHFPG